MSKILINLIFLVSFLNANYFEVNLKNKKEKNHEFIFQESINDLNSTNNNYKDLYETQNNIILDLSFNFNDNIGLNYDRTLSGNDDETKELYIGTPSMKYLSYSINNKDVSYNGLKTSKETSNITLFNIIDISKEKFRSSSHEKVSDEKNILFLINDENKTIYRDYELEKFTLTSEHFYDMAKEDARNNNTYILPGMFSKVINNNFKIYGVAILGLVQYNYTDISNYIKDSNGSKQNISFKNKDDNGNIILDKTQTAEDMKKFNLIGKYRGYEYGYKITAQYDVKKYSLFLTSYYKATSLKNKHAKNNSGNVASELSNALTYEKLKFTQYYLDFGIKYIF